MLSSPPKLSIRAKAASFERRNSKEWDPPSVYQTIKASLSPRLTPVKSPKARTPLANLANTPVKSAKDEKAKAAAKQEATTPADAPKPPNAFDDVWDQVEGSESAAVQKAAQDEEAAQEAAWAFWEEAMGDVEEGLERFFNPLALSSALLLGLVVVVASLTAWLLFPAADEAETAAEVTSKPSGAILALTDRLAEGSHRLAGAAMLTLAARGSSALHALHACAGTVSTFSTPVAKAASAAAEALRQAGGEAGGKVASALAASMRFAANEATKVKLAFIEAAAPAAEAFAAKAFGRARVLNTKLRAGTRRVAEGAFNAEGLRRGFGARPFAGFPPSFLLHLA